MKLKSTILLACMSMLFICLFSCKDAANTPCPHVDANGDLLCDKCGTIDSGYENPNDETTRDEIPDNTNPSIETPSEEAIFSEGLSYSINSKRDSYIVSGIGTCTDINIIIPSKYNDLPVRGINEEAFKGCNSLTSVTIPDGVVSIGKSAFYDCSRLTHITIPDSVISIGREAFFNCTSISSIVIPDGVKEIGVSTFEGCSNLTSVTVGKGITSITSFAFASCYKLVEVINKSSLDITVGSNSYGGVGAYAIVVHNDVTKIENQNGYLFLTYRSNNYLVAYAGSDIDLVLPKNYNGENYAIHNNAFRNCEYIASVTIPSSIKGIGSYVFAGQRALTVYCEASSQPLEWDSHWNYYGGANYENTPCPVVWDCKNNDIADNGYIYTLWDGIRYALKDGEATVARQPKNNKTSINIPALVTYKNNTYTVARIGKYAFSNLKFTSIIIPDSITNIDYYAFNYFNYLENVFYTGTESQWSSISINTEGFGNDDLLYEANRYYYSETEPTCLGNYWHYVDGVVTIWE